MASSVRDFYAVARQGEVLDRLIGSVRDAGADRGGYHQPILTARA